MALISRVTIQGYRGAHDVVLEPGRTCVLVGESSSGKSTVLSAIWTLLEAAAPMPTGEDVSRGYSRVHVEAVAGAQTLFLDARPPATLNLNREGARARARHPDRGAGALPEPAGAAPPAPPVAAARGARAQPGAVLDARAGVPRRRPPRGARPRPSRRADRHDPPAAAGTLGAANLPARHRTRRRTRRDLPLARSAARRRPHGEARVPVRLRGARPRRRAGGDLGDRTTATRRAARRRSRRSGSRTTRSSAWRASAAA